MSPSPPEHISLVRRSILLARGEGWVANLVIAIAILFLGPLVGASMKSTRGLIIGAAISVTVLVWAAAVLALRALKDQTPGSSSDSQLPAATSSTPTSSTVGKGGAQPSASVSNSVNTTVIQAGRDVVLQGAPPPVVPTARPTISSLVIEVRVTFELRPGSELPPDEVPWLPLSGGEALLKGGPEDIALVFVSPVRFRRLDGDRLMVINRFALKPDAYLHGRPLESLRTYHSLQVPVQTIVFGRVLSVFRLLEVSLSLNAGDPAYGSYPYNVPFQEGLQFTIPLAPLLPRLLK